jgi:hypothetical protein
MVCGHTTVLTAPYLSTLQHWMILSQEHFWCIVYLQATVSTSSMWRRQRVLVTGTLLQQALWIPIQYASVLLRAGGQSIHGRKSQHVHAGWKCCLRHAGDEWQQWGRETVTVLPCDQPTALLFLVYHPSLPWILRLCTPGWPSEQMRNQRESQCLAALLEIQLNCNWLNVMWSPLSHLPYNHSEYLPTSVFKPVWRCNLPCVRTDVSFSS